MAQGLLDIPKKMEILLREFDNYRYFLIKGGRGGSKSQTVSRFILTLAERYLLRIVCGREIQVNINESVHSILADLIREHNLAYEILKTRIDHKISGSSMNFRGFREQGVFNIQGMEGVDILWIDEAQALTKTTLDVLIPTIRKQNAKVIFTMNPHVADDAVVAMFEGRSDCLVIDINYDENEYCPQALIHEAEECKKKDIEDYNHIWLGKPLEKSEDAVFNVPQMMLSLKNKYPLRTGYGYRIAGFDIARYGDDKCAVVVLQQMGALHWEEIFCDEWGQKDLNYTTGRILDVIGDKRVDQAIIDEDGIGSGPLDTLQKGRKLNFITGFRNPSVSYADNKDYANNRTVQAYKVKKMFENGYLHLNTESIIKELATIKYTYDHQQRKILISKQIMRDKFKIKSPNKADALMMAVSLIDGVKVEQDRQYAVRPQQAREENLFNIAGIR